MARKKGRVPSPSPSPPPPTPPREESSSDQDDEEEATPAAQKAPQNPKPLSTAAADADSSDGGEEESDHSETDADAYQFPQAARFPGKPLESDADEGDGSSSDSPDPVQTRPARNSGKKRQAAESIPSGVKPKKAKADAAPLSRKPPSEPNSTSKGKKLSKEKAVPDRSPSKTAGRRWTIEDEIKVLEALVSHTKANGTQPSAVQLIAAVGDSLERKTCTKTEMYEKVRHLKQRHEKAATTGTLPDNDDDLHKFNLSEAVWGESAKEVAAAPISQNDAATSMSNKGQTNKEKKGGTAKEATSTVNENVGTVTKEKLDGASKGRLSNKAANTDTPVKSKKRGNHKEDLEGDAKTKETTNTATQNGSTLVRTKSGKSDKEEKDGDADSLGPKEATAVTQNGESHEDKMDIDPSVKNMRREFDQLQNLYPNLASYVESIQAQHPCGETLKRAFEFIADDKACALESKIKKQRVIEMKTEIRRVDTKKEVTNIFIGLLD
ncbi:probable transcription factor At4g00390 [Lolium rigidum]|uniref:probable transcription factor At4g00390 n=1 Tax=Lolium rigidum TaxID=89674 RepID=UPI001F5D7F25|nr:probable transcription factor At4g00390 [Lolium rigidum]